jgi:anti-sigma regulatory factor (Ser/Thr protein kinase)
MFCLAFGCEELSVSVMRQVLGDTLRALGVEEESVYDILLAATEACTSVLGAPGYAIVTTLSGTKCQVEVTGPDFTDPGVDAEQAADRNLADQNLAADRNLADRNLAVARACVDDMTLRRRPDRGAVVTMCKSISWSWDAPLRRLATAR